MEFVKQQPDTRGGLPPPYTNPHVTSSSSPHLYGETENVIPSTHEDGNSVQMIVTTAQKVANDLVQAPASFLRDLFAGMENDGTRAARIIIPSDTDGIGIHGISSTEQSPYDAATAGGNPMGPPPSQSDETISLDGRVNEFDVISVVHLIVIVALLMLILWTIVIILKRYTRYAYIRSIRDAADESALAAEMKKVK